MVAQRKRNKAESEYSDHGASLRFSKRQLNGEHSCKKCSLFTIQCSIVILEKLRPSFGACWSVVRKSFLNKSGGRRIPIIESEIRLADFRRSPSAPIESICRLVTRLDG